MLMPLVATEDGVAMFVKQIGVSLDPGDIIGILTLDDPGRVKHAKPFEGQLPQLGAPGVLGSKPHQRLNYSVNILNNILDGYVILSDFLPMPTGVLILFTVMTTSSL